RDLRARQAVARPVLELADAARAARLRALVLARRAAGAPEDRRAAAGHAFAEHRRADDHRRARDPDRRAVGDASILDVRQDHHHLRVRGLRHARLLAGAHAHDPLRCPARLAPDLGPALADVGVPRLLGPAVGLRGAPGPADPGRHVRWAGRLLALHAPGDARGGAAGLHPVGAGQGAL